MSERDAILRAILADPFDDAPRLVFADWLDEHGESEISEFIQIQIEYEKYRSYDLSVRVFRIVDDGLPNPFGNRKITWCNLDFGRHTGTKAIGVSFRRGLVERIVCTYDLFVKHAKIIFSHQPVTQVNLTDKIAMSHWLLEDRERHIENPDRDDRRTMLKAKLFRRLPLMCGPVIPFAGFAPFNTAWYGDAQSALSIACVNYGREVAGLSPLP